MPRPILYRAALLAISLTAACGGTGTTGPSGNANFTASIDNTPWASQALVTQAVGAAGGIFTIVGSSGGSTPTSMSITLYHIGAPGTYPLGVSGVVPGGIATLAVGTNTYSTPLTGAAGQVVITSVSATRIAGSFQFTAAPTLGSAANKSVTSGQFDLTVTGNGNITVAPNAGSKYGGTVGGLPWNAAVVVMVAAPSSGTLTIGASNTLYNINLIISGYTGTGTYPLGTGVQRSVTVIGMNPTRTWGGTGLGSGNVIVTSATASRIVGTINITLQSGVASPGPGTMTLVVNFDVGVP